MINGDAKLQRRAVSLHQEVDVERQGTKDSSKASIFQTRDFSNDFLYRTKVATPLKASQFILNSYSDSLPLAPF